LRDLALDDHEHAHYGPRLGDWLLLGFVVAGLVGNGLYVWHQLGPANDHTGRAIFFGLSLLAALWAALIYTFKLSVCVRVGPHSISVVRGPWRTELAWAQVTRLVERVQMVNRQRLRWVVAMARDGRSLQVREDMVNDYAAFRVEVWERYRLWRDHGGTWGATGGGPYAAHETASTRSAWWLILALTALLPGLYFTFILSEVGLLGPILILVALLCAMLSLRTLLGRQTYSVDAKAIQSKRFLRTMRLNWRDVKRVERTRRSYGGLLELGIQLGRVALRLAARGDGRVESFDWYPRVPEFLILRGAGRQIRIRLHRLDRPDEMLAWVEFYERSARHAAEAAVSRRTGPPQLPPATGAPLPAAADLTGASGPVDPWGEGRQGVVPSPLATGSGGGSPEPPVARSASEVADDSAVASADPRSAESSSSWLRAESSGAWHPGMPQVATGPFAARPEHPPVAESPAAETPTEQRADSAAAPLYGSTFGAAQPASARPPQPRTTGDLSHPEPSYPASAWQPSYQSPPQQRQPEAWSPAAEPMPQPGWAPTPVPQWPGQAEPKTELPDEMSAAAEDAPTNSSEPLADAFKFWRTPSQAPRPQFPRYGPAPGAEPTQPDDPTSFDRDEFLR
jgi:hypothetical protein